MVYLSGGPEILVKIMPARDARWFLVVNQTGVQGRERKAELLARVRARIGHPSLRESSAPPHRVEHDRRINSERGAKSKQLDQDAPYGRLRAAAIEESIVLFTNERFVHE
jgi:hypothetical protein